MKSITKVVVYFFLFVFIYFPSLAADMANHSLSKAEENDAARVAIRAGEHELFVDAASGSDSNSGTSTRPFKTIGRAAQLALANSRRNLATTITVNPGIYRESIEISGGSPDAGGPITIQASKIGCVTISGSEQWTGWQADRQYPGMYVHSWPESWATDESPKGFPAMDPIVLRREMIFVNGKLLTQVLSQNQMSEGSFFIDDSNGRASIWPPFGTDMAAADVEVSVRPKLFESHRLSGLTLRGLRFEHANPSVAMRPAAAVAIFNGANELVEDCKMNWNNWIGFLYNNVTNSTARRVVASHNGGVGMSGFRFKNVTIEDVQTSYNNWRGALGKFKDWEPSGGKFLRLHGAIFKRYTAVGNQARGLWFDTDNEDIVVDQAFLSQNQLDGLFLESNKGPFTIKNSKICRNAGPGIYTSHTEAVTVTANLICGNQKSQIFVNGQSRQRAGSNWETGAGYIAIAQRWSLSENTIVGGDAGQLLFGTYQSSPESSSLFFQTLTSDNNTWYNSSNENVFEIDPGGAGHEPRDMNISQWRSATGQDKDSTFGVPPADPVALCETR
jgi:Right handed beta helix region